MRKTLTLGAAACLTAGLAACSTTTAAVQLQSFHTHSSSEHSFNGSLLAQLTANPNCTLKVPADPLTAKGLATPYELGSAGMTCSESSEATAAFVQAVILTPGGQLEIYNPVVKNAGQTLLGTAPAVPAIPKGSVVTIWTGFNANVLKLVGPGQGGFVNFAQQAYDNSPQFFAALQKSGITPPALGTENGMTCPSVRDFSVVDQDQSDNVPVSYPAYGTDNGSDDDLLTYIDASLGCKPWEASVISEGGGMSTAGPLEEMQAALQGNQALVPGLDPFVTSGGQPNLTLQNLYRAQVGQPPAASSSDTKTYCMNLASIGEPRLQADAASETAAPPPFAPIGSNLALALANRYQQTWTNLTCPALTGMTSPITVDNPDFATSAQYGVSMKVAQPPKPIPAPKHHHHE